MKRNIISLHEKSGLYYNGIRKLGGFFKTVICLLQKIRIARHCRPFTIFNFAPVIFNDKKHVFGRNKKFFFYRRKEQVEM